MIDNINSVPARIVILGTSKMKLSERFSQLSSERDGNSTSKSSFRRGYEPQAQLSSSSSFGNGVGGLVSDSRNGHYPLENSNNNSFLFDEYMSNDLFSRRSDDNGGHSNSRALFGNSYHRQQPVIRKQSLGYQPPMRKHYSYAPVNDYYDDEDLFTSDPLDNLDPLSLPLDTYRELNRARRRSSRRPFQGLQAIYSMPGRRGPAKRGGMLASQIYEEYYRPTRPSMRHRTTKRTPIHNRITIKRLARPAPFSNLYNSNNYRGASTFKNNDYRRGAGGTGGRFKRGAGARFGVNSRKAFNKQPQPKKKTPAELDKDLEMYMNSGKHPRVAPVV